MRSNSILFKCITTSGYCEVHVIVSLCVDSWCHQTALTQMDVQWLRVIPSGRRPTREAKALETPDPRPSSTLVFLCCTNDQIEPQVGSKTQNKEHVLTVFCVCTL